MRRVLLVEDHAAFRQALTDVLNMQPDLEVVGRAGSFAEGRTAAAALVEEVDVAVVDVFLPDGNGVELVRELRRADPGLSIVILTAGVDPDLHALALEAGADEVCVKAEGIEEIMKAIRASPPTAEEDQKRVLGFSTLLPAGYYCSGAARSRQRR
jgi:DNA-binding NarL/FixJ family response regulator